MAQTDDPRDTVWLTHGDYCPQCLCQIFDYPGGECLRCGTPAVRGKFPPGILFKNLRTEVAVIKTRLRAISAIVDALGEVV